MSRSQHRSANRQLPWIARAPLALILIAAVVAIVAGLIAVQFLPAFAAVQKMSDRITAEVDRIVDDSYLKIKFPQTSSIYDVRGRQLTTVSSGENRKVVKLEKMGQYARDAVIAIEDHNFYQHGGIDPWSIVRAAVSNFIAGEVTQGGSTLTQQLVKNAIIGSNEQTIQRKLQEAALAAQMEREYTKDEILELYMNQVYLANGVYGIGTASEYYFNKPPAKLSLPQAALLAGIPQRPEDYDPIRHAKAAKSRRNAVLDDMARYGFVTAQAAEKAKEQPIKLKVTRRSDKDDDQEFFTHHVIYDILDTGNPQWDKLFGDTYKQRLATLGTGGYRIYTTYDPKLEAAAESIAQRQLGTGRGLDTAIASVVPGTGEVKLLLSGKDYHRDGYNLVAAEVTNRGTLLGVRQPGSSFKPYTLLAAFEEGIPASTRYPSNSPMKLDGWDNACKCVANAEPFGGYGNIDLWTATAHSVNVVFAQLVLQVGPETVVDVAQRAGIRTSNLEPYPSITLGSEEISPLEQASGYATIANHGTYCKPYMITKIVGPKGNTLYRHKAECKEVIDPKVADLTTNLLEGVINGGTGGAAALGRPAAGKTGTSQDQADLWFAGYTPSMATAVWVGNPTRREPTSYYGGTIAAPIWKSVMQVLLRGVPAEGFKNADDVKGKKSKVPDVVGMSETDALRVLSRAGFSATSQEVDSTEPKGTVVSQSPPGGSQVSAGTAVVIDVSNGRSPEERVPGVTGMVLYEAQQQLRAAGFSVSVSYVDTPDKGENRIVLTQSPPGGSKAQPGSTITLNVGKYVKDDGGGGGGGGGGDGGGGGGGSGGGGGTP